MLKIGESGHRGGRKLGYQAGWDQGWRIGASQAVLNSTPAAAVKRFPLKVLYIPQGFDSIDEGIIAALHSSVQELHVGEAARMKEQAVLWRPDLVVVLNGLHVFPPDHLNQIDAIRSMGIKTLVWFADDPYVTEETTVIAPRYDIVLTHELSTISLYQGLGCKRVVYMPLAAHTKLFRPIAVPSSYQSDVCFIGQGFWNRIRLFDELLPTLRNKQVFVAGGLWERLRKESRSVITTLHSGWLPIEESVKYYNGAKIVINIHRTTEKGLDNRNTLNLSGRSINPRTYEIAACGTMQLTDRREDLGDYYRPGIELDTYADAGELAEKIHYYLEHETERRRAALFGLRRTVRNHTYLNRVQQWLSKLMTEEGSW